MTEQQLTIKKRIAIELMPEIHVKDLANIIKLMQTSIEVAQEAEDLRNVATAAAHWKLLITKGKKMVKDLITEPNKEIKHLETSFKVMQQAIKDKFKTLYEATPNKSRGIFTYSDRKTIVEIDYTQISLTTHRELYVQKCEYVLDDAKVTAAFDKLPHKMIIQESRVGILWKQLEQAAKKIDEATKKNNE